MANYCLIILGGGGGGGEILEVVFGKLLFKLMAPSVLVCFLNSFALCAELYKCPAL